VDRQSLMRDLLGEFADHNPASAMRYMRHWPGGKLSLVHVQVISLLEADGPQPMRALAEALDVSQASATGIVDRMEQRGLVERQRADEDRRIVRVILTDEGSKLLAGVADARRGHMIDMLAELSDEELAAYLLAMRAMRRVRDRRHALGHANPASPVPHPQESGS